MKSVFAHDHVFITWAGEVYSPGRLPYAAWRRYLEHFSSLTVIARGRTAASALEVRGLNRSDGPGVQFALQCGQRGVRRLLPIGRQAVSEITALVRNADAVIARLPSGLGLRVAHMANAAGRPLALEIVGSALHSLWHHGSLAAKLYAPLLDVRTKWVASRASAALYVTRDYLQTRYPCKGLTASASNVVIPRLDAEILEARKTRILHSKLPLVLGFVGTLADRHKGLDTLLLASAILKARGVSCAIQVVGEGDCSYWRNLAKSLHVEQSVQFMGTLPGSTAVREWMQQIDVFVLPSKGGEGLPRALIEAMSCGCLSFATDVGGIPELLTSEFLFQPGDSERLVRLIENAVKRPSLLLEAIDINADVASRYSEDVLETARRQFFAQLAHRARCQLGSDEN